MFAKRTSPRGKVRGTSHLCPSEFHSFIHSFIRPFTITSVICPCLHINTDTRRTVESDQGMWRISSHVQTHQSRRATLHPGSLLPVYLRARAVDVCTLGMSLCMEHCASTVGCQEGVPVKSSEPHEGKALSPMPGVCCEGMVEHGRQICRRSWGWVSAACTWLWRVAGVPRE